MTESLTVVVWPLRNERWVALAWTVIPLLAGFVVAKMAGVAWGIAAAACVMAAVWRVFIPVTIRITDDGVYQTVMGSQRFRAWPTISWYRLYPNGVMLFVDKDRSVFAALRGLYIPFGKHKRELVEIIERNLADDTSFELTA